MKIFLRVVGFGVLLLLAGYGLVSIVFDTVPYTPEPFTCTIVGHG